MPTLLYFAMRGEDEGPSHRAERMGFGGQWSQASVEILRFYPSSEIWGKGKRAEDSRRRLFRGRY